MSIRRPAMRAALAAVVIMVVILGAVAGAFAVAGWEVHRSQQQWCTSLGLLTATPVASPADPAKNPSRVQQYKLYSDFRMLSRRFGC